jgi:hypothetical protein
MKATGISPLVIVAIAAAGVFAVLIVAGGFVWARVVERRVAAQGPPQHAFPRANPPTTPPWAMSDPSRPNATNRPTIRPEAEDDDTDPTPEWNFVVVSNPRLENEHIDPRLPPIVGGQNRVLSFDWTPGPAYDKAPPGGRLSDLYVMVRSPDGVGSLRLDTAIQFGPRGAIDTVRPGGVRTMSVQKFGVFRTFNTPVEVWVVKGKKRVSNRAVLN